MVMRAEVLYEILSVLHKVYDALDRNHCLDIFAVYGVGPRAIRILRQYWERLTMVTRAVGYYRTPFKGFRGVTQGGPLSPTIFNVDVDAVLRRWVTMVEVSEEAVPPGAANTEGFGMNMQRLAEYFYADHGIIVLTWVTRPQRDFDTLT